MIGGGLAVMAGSLLLYFFKKGEPNGDKELWRES